MKLLSQRIQQALLEQAFAAHLGDSAVVKMLTQHASAPVYGPQLVKLGYRYDIDDAVERALMYRLSPQMATYTVPEQNTIVAAARAWWGSTLDGEEMIRWSSPQGLRRYLGITDVVSYPQLREAARARYFEKRDLDKLRRMSEVDFLLVTAGMRSQ